MNCTESVLIANLFFTFKVSSSACFFSISPYRHLLPSSSQNKQKIPPSLSWGHRHIHVVCVVLRCKQHVLSREKAFPDKRASSLDTISSHNFSKVLLSLSEQLVKSCEMILLKTLFHWAISCLSFCNFIIFPHNCLLQFLRIFEDKGRWWSVAISLF